MDSILAMDTSQFAELEVTTTCSEDIVADLIGTSKEGIVNPESEGNECGNMNDFGEVTTTCEEKTSKEGETTCVDNVKQ